MRARTGMLAVAWRAWRVERAGGDAVAARQQARLAELVRHARAASPYYRRLYRDLPARVDPRLLPPVTKRDLMEHFDEWVTDPDLTLERLSRDFLSDPSLVGSRYLGRYHVFTTSGTTGEPAVLVHDHQSWTVAMVLARRYEAPLLARWTVLCAVLRHGLRPAALFATGGHFAGAASVQSLRRRAPFIARRIRLLSVLAPLPELVETLDDFRPNVLEGYPSAIALLAAEQQAGRLSIDPFLAITTGEHLSDAVRTRIETTFGCRISNRYGASEAPALAVECARGVFHVNADWYVLEPVDEDYLPVSAGVTSHTVLVTNLANRVQPVIRYDLGDRVQVAPAPCPCGSPLPAIRVEGRTDEALAFEAPDGSVVTALPLALATVIEETPGVRRFQAIRTGPRTLTVRLEMRPGVEPDEVWASVDRRLDEFFTTLGACPVSVEHDRESPAPDATSGKLRQVWSEASHTR